MTWDLVILQLESFFKVCNWKMLIFLLDIMQLIVLLVGCYNIFFGTCAASACTPTGNFNVVIGGCAGYCSTGAACNILLGRDAYRKNETGSNNVILGNRAGCSNLLFQ